MNASGAIATGACPTCRGVLGLEDRLVRLRVTNAQPTERSLAEVRWFRMTLAKVKPCPAHEGVMELAEELETTLAAALMGKEAQQ